MPHTHKKGVGGHWEGVFIKMFKETLIQAFSSDGSSCFQMGTSCRKKDEALPSPAKVWFFVLGKEASGLQEVYW